MKQQLWWNSTKDGLHQLLPECNSSPHLPPGYSFNCISTVVFFSSLTPRIRHAWHTHKFCTMPYTVHSFFFCFLWIKSLNSWKPLPTLSCWPANEERCLVLRRCHAVYFPLYLFKEEIPSSLRSQVSTKCLRDKSHKLQILQVCVLLPQFIPLTCRERFVDI